MWPFFQAICYNVGYEDCGLDYPFTVSETEQVLGRLLLVNT